MRFGPFLLIASLLFILWIAGFLLLHVASAMIHLLLFIAIIALFMHFFTGPPRAAA
jgi:hypothetical protein